MRYAVSLLVITGALTTGGAQVQAQSSTGDARVLATVRIPQAVLANGQRLAAGTYELRLTSARPTRLPGQSPDAERWVELVTNGMVVGREAAVVLRADDLPSEGASSVPTREGARVDLLKGGEFLRISVAQGGERYLLYLPVAP